MIFPTQSKRPFGTIGCVATSEPAASIAVVVVTYASQRVLSGCIQALQLQSRPPDLVVIVDNCSPDPSYLSVVPPHEPFVIVRNNTNEGFCGGNNIGYQLAKDHKYVLFLNPDAFLTASFIQDAISWLERPATNRIGALTGTLLGFDIENWKATGLVDSTGIFQTWYGRWYDRHHGKKSSLTIPPTQPEDIPAICGALMLCRAEALENALLPSGDIFDPAFFMYKEDIDLSLRLSAKGWRLSYEPSLSCYHARGWQDRSIMPPRAKYLSARNEIRLCLRNNPRALPYALAKFIYVIGFDRHMSTIIERIRHFIKRRGKIS